MLLGFRRKFALMYSDDAGVIALAAELLPVYVVYQFLTAVRARRGC